MNISTMLPADYLEDAQLYIRPSAFAGSLRAASPPRVDRVARRRALRSGRAATGRCCRLDRALRHQPAACLSHGVGSRVFRHSSTALCRDRADSGQYHTEPNTGDPLMNMETHQKVTAVHLKRNAYLYVRQSTVRQVFENSESTARQYALRQRAIALGWPEGQIIVIDSDLGQSGASAVDREGFQKLVGETGMGRAGIVLGLEVSRLARNSADWHRLLEICALTDTLILDEDGIYDPAHFNDRLLLGLKGTMSEAELHMLRARLRGGILNKARRGDLRCRLPVGLVYDTRGCVVFDPDKQVQETVRLLFQTFDRTGTLRATIKYFRKHGLLFPTQIVAGAQKGQLAWVPLSLGRASSAMHNPWYAGAYAYGRSRWRKQPDGRECYERLPQDQWQVLIRDAHPAYISWQEYERNAQRLRASA